MYVPASLQQADRHLKAGHALSPEQLALLLERNSDQVLTPILLKYLVTTLRGRGTLPTGRKKGISAQIDFLVGDYIDLYDKKLEQFRAKDHAERAEARAKGRTLPKGRYSAYERAARFVTAVMKENTGETMSPKRFLNAVSQITNRGVPPEDQVDPGENPVDFIASKGRRQGRRR
jgi:hypothetical protein